MISWWDVCMTLRTTSGNSWNSGNWKVWVENNVMTTVIQIMLSVYMALPNPSLHWLPAPFPWQHLCVQVMTLRLHWKIKILAQGVGWQSHTMTRISECGLGHLACVAIPQIQERDRQTLPDCSLNSLSLGMFLALTWLFFSFIYFSILVHSLLNLFSLKFL